DSNARTDISVQNYIRGRLARVEQILEFLNQSRSDLAEGFKETLQQKLVGNMSDSKIDVSIEEYRTIAGDYPLIIKNSSLIDSIITFMIGQLDLPESFTTEMEKVDVSLLSVERGENLVTFYAVQTLVELTDRETGIKLYKDIVDYLGRNAEHRDLKDFREARVKWVDGMANSGGFAFAVHDIDEDMFLAKFDRCVVYESLKDMCDPELGYLVTCYTGMTIGQHRDWCVRMRRTQTLFSGKFCDELYWNRHVHDDPEQPSLEFSRELDVE
ncbi:MAG: hypothetical protein RTU92_05695, partial [Candidatus Thorarchaeota archaeon]